MNKVQTSQSENVIENNGEQGYFTEDCHSD